jgi:hypothetical protein
VNPRVPPPSPPADWRSPRACSACLFHTHTRCCVHHAASLAQPPSSSLCCGCTPSQVGGSWLRDWMGVAGVVSSVAILCTMLCTTARMLEGMANTGNMPRFFSRLHSKVRSAPRRGSSHQAPGKLRRSESRSGDDAAV